MQDLLGCKVTSCLELNPHKSDLMCSEESLQSPLFIHSSILLPLVYFQSFWSSQLLPQSAFFSGWKVDTRNLTCEGFNSYLFISYLIHISYLFMIFREFKWLLVAVISYLLFNHACYYVVYVNMTCMLLCCICYYDMYVIMLYMLLWHVCYYVVYVIMTCMLLCCVCYYDMYVIMLYMLLC